MRITKSELRSSKNNLSQVVNDLFKMDDAKLKTCVEASFSGIKVEVFNREELLRLAIQWAIEVAIPSRLVD